MRGEASELIHPFMGQLFCAPCSLYFPDTFWFPEVPFCSPVARTLGFSFPAPYAVSRAICFRDQASGGQPERESTGIHVCLGSQLFGLERRIPFLGVLGACLVSVPLWECWGLEEERRKKKQKKTPGRPPPPLFLKLSSYFLALGQKVRISLEAFPVCTWYVCLLVGCL